MKQISESEMLHRAAAYCSASERCIQDVEKKIKAAGLAGEESGSSPAYYKNVSSTKAVLHAIS